MNTSYWLIGISTIIIGFIIYTVLSPRLSKKKAYIKNNPARRKRSQLIMNDDKVGGRWDIMTTQLIAPYLIKMLLKFGNNTHICHAFKWEIEPQNTVQAIAGDDPPIWIYTPETEEGRIRRLNNANFAGSNGQDETRIQVERRAEQEKREKELYRRQASEEGDRAISHYKSIRESDRVPTPDDRYATK